MPTAYTCSNESFCCKLFVKYCLIVITVYGNKQVKKKKFWLVSMKHLLIVKFLPVTLFKLLVAAILIILFVILSLWKRSRKGRHLGGFEEVFIWMIPRAVLILEFTCGVIDDHSLLGLHSHKTQPRGLQIDVVYFGWPIAPSSMSPNARGGGGGVAGSQPMSTAVHRI